MSADKEISDILGRYGEPMAGNVWSVQGNKVIYHKALERIAARAGIWFADPVIVRAERDEAVVLVKGSLGPEGKASPYADTREEWSIGEALIGANYRVSGKQAAYVYAMAEKRGKDRVILKLIGLHGLLYSEDEADDFKDGRPENREELPRKEVMRQAIESGEDVDTGDGVVTAESALARQLDGIRTKIETYKQADTLEALMKSEEVQSVLRSVGDAEASELRTYAWRRIRQLRDAPNATTDPDAYTRAKEGA